MKKMYGIMLGLALGMGICVSAVSADERFTALEGVPAEAMSADQMAQIEGKASSAELWRLITALVLSQQAQTNQLFPAAGRAVYQQQVQRFSNALNEYLTKPIDSRLPAPNPHLPTGLCSTLSCALNVTHATTSGQSLFNPFYGINPNILQGVR